MATIELKSITTATPMRSHFCASYVAIGLRPRHDLNPILVATAQRNLIKLPSPRLILLFIFLQCALLNADQKPEAFHFFGLTNLWTVELRFTASQWKQLQAGNRAPSPDTPKSRADDSDRNYTYSHADLRIADRIVTNVGVRLKGAGTQAGNAQERWPFRIDLDKYAENQRIDGASKISFNNNYYDSSYLREALSYECFRSFGVPAPRTCFIKLFLSVPGSYERKYLGLYNAAEGIETQFVKSHFKDGSGLLLKPNFGLGGFPSRTDWQGLTQSLNPKNAATEAQHQRMIDFFKLLNQSNEKLFRENIGSFVNIDEYLRFLVVNVALVNQDSYLGMGKNYYIYLDKDSNKLNWLPWDLDLSMGGFFFCGGPRDRIELSIDRPSSIRDPLIRRVLAVPEYRDRYHNLMRDFLAKHFDKELMFDRIDLLSGIIRDAVMEEKSTRPEDFARSLDGRDGTRPTFQDSTVRWMLIEPGLKLFVEKRIESIQAQLAGKREGVRTGFGHVEPW